MVCRLQRESRMRTTAVIAAFNEEKTIADVCRSLVSSPLIDEVIVVSDGSTDSTVEIARSIDGVRTVALRENQGKGHAMRVGVDNASNDILFFVDGDMYNVTEEHIESLVLPVMRGECDMNIGVRNRGDVFNFFHLKMQCGPVLSGTGLGATQALIVSDLPLQGDSRQRSLQMNTAIRTVLANANWQAGGRQIGFQACRHDHRVVTFSPNRAVAGILHRAPDPPIMDQHRHGSGMILPFQR